MKTLKFETSKGRFLVVDGIDISVYGATFVAKLLEISEEQASEIVDSEYVDFINKYIYRDYESISAKEVFCDKLNAIESLHSLLKSKGIHLYKNPYLDFKTLDINAIEAEQKTFYNPYIFKL